MYNPSKYILQHNESKEDFRTTSAQDILNSTGHLTI